MSDEIERLRAVLEAATPGPWSALYGSRDVLDMVHAEGTAGTVILADVHDLGGAPGTPNTIAIAAAVTLLPALLDIAEAASEAEEDCECKYELANPRVGECGTCSTVRAARAAIREHLGEP